MERKCVFIISYVPVLSTISLVEEEVSVQMEDFKYCDFFLPNFILLILS